MAALTWRSGTCADAALDEATGYVATVEPLADDGHAAEQLAKAIESAAKLRAVDVQAVGKQRFDPRYHFERLATRP